MEHLLDDSSSSTISSQNASQTIVNGWTLLC